MEHPNHTFISNEELNKLPLFRYDGPIHVIDTRKDLSEAVKSLGQETILGFDTETRPVFRKGKKYPTSLLQLASANEVYLLRLTHIGFTAGVANLLADSGIIKIGVGIRDDLKELQEMRSFTPSNFIDLQHIAKARNIKKTSLRSLSAIFLQVRVSKRAQLSPWHRAILSERQIRYAATDAWIPRKIYLHMLEEGMIE